MAQVRSPPSLTGITLPTTRRYAHYPLGGGKTYEKHRIPAQYGGALGHAKRLTAASSVHIYGLEVSRLAKKKLPRSRGDQSYGSGIVCFGPMVTSHYIRLY